MIWNNSTDADTRNSLKYTTCIEWPVGDPIWPPKKIMTCNFSSADTLKRSFIDDSENFVCAREQLLHLKSQNSTLISLDLKWINFNAKVQNFLRFLKCVLIKISKNFGNAAYVNCLKNIVLYNLENHDDIQLKMNQFLCKNRKPVLCKYFDMCMNVTVTCRMLHAVSRPKFAKSKSPGSLWIWLIILRSQRRILRNQLWLHRDRTIRNRVPFTVMTSKIYVLIIISIERAQEIILKAFNLCPRKYISAY